MTGRQRLPVQAEFLRIQLQIPGDRNGSTRCSQSGRLQPVVARPLRPPASPANQAQRQQAQHEQCERGRLGNRVRGLEQVLAQNPRVVDCLDLSSREYPVPQGQIVNDAGEIAGSVVADCNACGEYTAVSGERAGQREVAGMQTVMIDANGRQTVGCQRCHVPLPEDI
jgi:hypothetical protein